jgi:hypothetical protein
MTRQVMSTIYPTSVKQKLLVNALLALCPVMLWIAHSIAGARAPPAYNTASASFLTVFAPQAYPSHQCNRPCGWSTL